jgi:hypothetical protein
VLNVHFASVLKMPLTGQMLPVGSRLKAFEACIPILRVDTQASQFLLPYVVQNVVCYGADEARQGVLNEVPTALIRQGLHTADFGKPAGCKGMHQALCTGHLSDLQHSQPSCCRQVEAVLRGGQSSREGELCVQALFTLLDMLRTWLAGQRGFAGSSGGA